MDGRLTKNQAEIVATALAFALESTSLRDGQPVSGWDTIKRKLASDGHSSDEIMRAFNAITSRAQRPVLLAEGDFE